MNNILIYNIVILKKHKKEKAILMQVCLDMQMQVKALYQEIYLLKWEKYHSIKQIKIEKKQNK